MRRNSVVTLAAIKSAAKEIGDVTLPLCEHSDEEVCEAAIQANHLAQEIYKVTKLIEQMERYAEK
jgi:hypothetical protein